MILFYHILILFSRSLYDFKIEVKPLPKLTRRQIKLQQAEEKLSKVIKRSKQFHLRFDRVQKGKRYKTTVKIERGDRNYSGNNHGLLHRAVNLKNRVTGDAPSLTKTIDSIQPETVKGKIAKGAAKAVNTAGHAAVHTAVNTGLAAETLTLNTADAVRNEVTHKLRQKYTQEAVDDGHRGTIAAARIAFDSLTALSSPNIIQSPVIKQTDSLAKNSSPIVKA